MFKSTDKIKAEKIKFFLLLIIVLTGILIVFFTDISKLTNLAYLKNFLKEKESEGIVIFLFFFVIRPFIPIPFSIMAIAAGFAFGKIIGFFLSFAGAFIGMCVEFGLSKKWGADFMGKETGKRINEIIAIATRGNVLTIALLRLVPLISHFDTLNYVLGITKIKFTTFITGSMLGISPWVIIFTLFGDSIRASNRPLLTVNIVLIPLIGISAFIIYRKMKSEKIKEKQ